MFRENMTHKHAGTTPSITTQLPQILRGVSPIQSKHTLRANQVNENHF